jgi:hypothetical protein
MRFSASFVSANSLNLDSQFSFNYTYTYFQQHRFTNMSALLIISSVLIFMMDLISKQTTQLRYDCLEGGG